MRHCTLEPVDNPHAQSHHSGSGLAVFQAHGLEWYIGEDISSPRAELSSCRMPFIFVSEKVYRKLLTLMQLLLFSSFHIKLMCECRRPAAKQLKVSTTSVHDSNIIDLCL